MIRLSAGDLVPADARLVESKDLHVQEAALTGESLPAEKETAPADAEPAADHHDTVYFGTSVVSGSAAALVFATGDHTEIGDIAARLAARSPESDFERGTRRFGFLIMQTVIFLVVFVLMVSIVLKRDTLQSLLFAVALAVGLTPEFLPMITTVTLGNGAVRMAKKKVIVKQVSAMQNFGSMDILCSDKTGTLTTGEMSLERSVDPSGKDSEGVFTLTYLNSYFETGITDPANVAALKKGGTNPLDLAVLRYGHPDVHAYRKLDEIPFDFERRMLSVVVEWDHKRILITKGAPESVLNVCASYEVEGRQAPLDDQLCQQTTAVFHDLSAHGYRVLAVAYRDVPVQNAYNKADEKDLVLVGYAAFIDPPLPDALKTIQDLRADGVTIKILTGDNDLVASHICAQVGLDVGTIVLGADLDNVSDSALTQIAETTTLFARVSPAQKNRIILALKRRSHVVGYMGDGINDAPSLHTADVGISFASATDVAKDAADIILLEPGLEVLNNGIIEGRKAFGNVMKYLLMGTSSNFGNMFSMAGASLFLPFLPMLATQILLNNFLYDLSQIIIPSDNVDESFTRQPKRWDITLIRRFMLLIGPISSIYDFLTFYVLLRVFNANESLFHTGWFVESLLTQTLVLFVIRTSGNPFHSRPSRPLAITTYLILVQYVKLKLYAGLLKNERYYSARYEF
jgi:Mg2+-importing ATPase